MERSYSGLTRDKIRVMIEGDVVEITRNGWFPHPAMATTDAVQGEVERRIAELERALLRYEKRG